MFLFWFFLFVCFWHFIGHIRNHQLSTVQSIHDFQPGIKMKHSVRDGHWLRKAASHGQHPLS